MFHQKQNSLRLFKHRILQQSNKKINPKLFIFGFKSERFTFLESLYKEYKKNKHASTTFHTIKQLKFDFSNFKLTLMQYSSNSCLQYNVT